MQPVVYQGPLKVRVKQIADARTKRPPDTFVSIFVPQDFKMSDNVSKRQR
jgi:hypothetical protein